MKCCNSEECAAANPAKGLSGSDTDSDDSGHEEDPGATQAHSEVCIYMVVCTVIEC